MHLARTLEVVAIRRFPFEFEPRYRRILWLMSVTPARSGVEIGDGSLRSRFGPWRVQTALSNIRCAEETGPYQALRAIGPHISMVDQGLSFGSTTRGGVCLLFHEAVPGRETLGLIKHPGLTVTVEDPVGLIDAIADAQRSTDPG
jgi:hypothetical protein